MLVQLLRDRDWLNVNVASANISLDQQQPIAARAEQLAARIASGDPVIQRDAALILLERAEQVQNVERGVAVIITLVLESRRSEPPLWVERNVGREP